MGIFYRFYLDVCDKDSTDCCIIHVQCNQIWQNIATLEKCHKSLMVYFFFLKMLCLLWQICDIIGLIFIVAIGQN